MWLKKFVCEESIMKRWMLKLFLFCVATVFYMGLWSGVEFDKGKMVFKCLINSVMADEVGPDVLKSEKPKPAGCLVCHDGIEVISDVMQPYLIAAARQEFGKGRGYECAVCHEGDPSSGEKSVAHNGLIQNPASMWVLHEGKGCAKCHDDQDSITSLMGVPLDEPVGGEIMSTTFTESNPASVLGTNYTYRMARSLIGLETGKANKTLSSNGVIEKGKFPYADFNMDDPDGAIPTVGSEKYKEWIKKAIETGYIKRLEKVEEIPDFHKGVEVFGSEEKAGFADIHRKQCARCHIWGEGRGKRGDLRGSGCASCHVPYGNDGKYEGEDKTMLNSMANRPHPIKHKITKAIPAAQCAHCHTRGKRIGTTFAGMFEYDYVKDGKAIPFDENAKPQEPLYTKEYLHVKADIHFERGLQCADCHTSIDVHGDGNIYPVTYYQVEVSCYDCHGTPDKYPWQLPVGYGTSVELDGERGVFKGKVKKTENEFLLTTRGNPKSNWIREGDTAYVLSRYTNKKLKIPLLKYIKDTDSFKTVQGKVAMSTVSQHVQKLECYTCHTTWAPQCFGCHIQYDRRKDGTDWVETSKKINPETGRQTITTSKGNISIENRSFMRWEKPILGVNFRGKISPLAPGCQVFYTYIDENGEIKTKNKFYQTSSNHNSPTLAPLFPHSVSLVARTCEDCHTDPKTIGYGTGNSKSAAKIIGDAPLFQDLSKGAYGDIPGIKSGKWQVPKIENFPYSLEQLVTRSGKQVQNMPLLKDRPLNKEERDLVEREGLCIACHKHYKDEEWQKLRNVYDRALTPEKHNDILEKAIKALMDKSMEKE